MPERKEKWKTSKFWLERLNSPMFAEGARTGLAKETDAEQRSLSLQLQVKKKIMSQPTKAVTKDEGVVCFLCELNPFKHV